MISECISFPCQQLMTIFYGSIMKQPLKIKIKQVNLKNKLYTQYELNFKGEAGSKESSFPLLSFLYYS